MGSWTSRQHAGVEEVDIISNHAYKYPPRSGNYFGSHFIMGGERFDTPQPEAYLFGENADLNFLGSRPTPCNCVTLQFPYPPPQANEPTKTLKSLINIRKESLRFVRAPPDCGKVVLENTGGIQIERDIEAGKGALFNIEFTFDCDARCAITIYYFCTEEITPNGIIYNPKDSSMNSETFHYKRGANQQFCQPLHVFNPTRYSDDELLYNPDREIIPIAIHCVVEEGSEEPKQSHTTIAVVEKHTDGTYVLKALKQKIFLDGLSYLLQELYGIENKNNDSKNTCDDDMEDNGSECVICMCDVRDTLILPCRHLCLCNSCADSLRYQANNCPICRAPFRALLQIRALYKTHSIVQAPTSPPDGSCENIPAGYEAVPLIEALNGPSQPRQPPAAPGELIETPEMENAVQAAEVLNRSNMERTPGKTSPKDSGDFGKSPRDRMSGVGNNTPEFRMSVLMQREEEGKETPRSPLLAPTQNGKQGNSQLNSSQRSNKCTRPRDSLRLMNEKAVLDKEEIQDDDSEGEKLSPLLDRINNQQSMCPAPALHMDAVIEPIDDTDTEHDEPSLNETASLKDKEKQLTCNDEAAPLREEKADDSDYYTPEEPVPATLNTMYTEKEKSNTAPSSIGQNSTENTPLRHPLGASLPGTPLSHISARSSGDSYSSSSSTKHLLAVVSNNTHNAEKAVHI